MAGSTGLSAAPGPVSQLRADLEGLNFIPNSNKPDLATAAPGTGEPGQLQVGSNGAVTPPPTAPPPSVQIAKEKIIEEVRRKEKDDKPVLSLVVVGEYTLMHNVLTFGRSMLIFSFGQVMSTLASRRSWAAFYTI